MRKLVIFFLLTVLLGCEAQPDKQPAALQPVTLVEVYPGEFAKITKIELADGSTGERKTIEDRQTIGRLLDRIKDVVLVPEEKQELIIGNIFRVYLYEGNDISFGFDSGTINGVNYKTNNDFVEPIRAFFAEQFGRAF